MSDTDASALARDAVLGFGELLALLAASGSGGAVPIRRADAIGAHIPAALGNPWFDAVVVPPGAPPPDPDSLPACIWSTAAVPGRIAAPDIVMPCMAIALAAAPVPGDARVESPPLPLVGTISAAAYGAEEAPVGDWVAPLFAAITDSRLRSHGLLVDGEFACVALTLRIGDDIAFHHVATEARCRRRGLAARLLIAVMAAARAEGARSATLQASRDGFPLYQQLGFRTLAMLQGHLRP